MQTLKTRHGEVDISSDMLDKKASKWAAMMGLPPDHPEVLQWEFEMQMEGVAYCIKRQGYSSPRNVRILKAHGTVNDGKYLYVEDAEKMRSYLQVEGWIAKHERSYDALYINPCNSPSTPIHLAPRTCFLVYPRELHYDLDIIRLAVSEPKGELIIVPPQNYFMHPDGIKCGQIELLIRVWKKMAELKGKCASI